MILWDLESDIHNGSVILCDYNSAGVAPLCEYNAFYYVIITVQVWPHRVNITRLRCVTTPLSGLE